MIVEKKKEVVNGCYYEKNINKKQLIDIIDFAVKATDGKDDYSVGLCNGMIYIKSILTDTAPEYKSTNKNIRYQFLVAYYLENGTINNSVVESDLPGLTSEDIQTIKQKLKKEFNQEIRIVFFTRLGD